MIEAVCSNCYDVSYANDTIYFDDSDYVCCANEIVNIDCGDVLQMLSEKYSMNKDDVAEKVMEMKIKETIEKEHNHKIWFAKKERRWKTKVRDNGKLRTVVSVDRDKLEKKLYDFYSDEAENKRKQEKSLTDIFPDWTEYKRLSGIAPNTISRYKRDWKKYCENTEIVKTPICEITEIMIEEWALNIINDFSLTVKAYTNCSGIIKNMLTYARKQGIIESNPFLKVEIDTNRVCRRAHIKPREEQIFTIEECDKVCALAWEDFKNGNCKVHKLAPLAIMFLFYSGLRIGELAALKHEDVSDDYSTITIRRSLRKDTGEILDGTKGKYGDRVVTLEDNGKEIIEAVEEKKKEMGIPIEGFLFSVTGNPLPYDATKKRFYKYCEKIGTPRKTAHNCRKTYVSILYANGVPEPIIQAQAGHCDLGTTRGYYMFDVSSDAEKQNYISKAFS